jgi:hypothetical protein
MTKHQSEPNAQPASESCTYEHRSPPGFCTKCDEVYERAINRMRSEIAELRGKDLACWCPLDQPCHADALLELANR